MYFNNIITQCVHIYILKDGFRKGDRWMDGWKMAGMTFADKEFVSSLYPESYIVIACISAIIKGNKWNSLSMKESWLTVQIIKYWIIHWTLFFICASINVVKINPFCLFDV